MVPVTIWMNVPSFHQDEFFRALVEAGQTDLRVIFSTGLPADRHALGWSSETGTYAQRVLPPQRLAAAARAARIAWAERDRIHVVNGIWAEPPFAAALTVLSAIGARFAVYSEAPDDSVWRSAPKHLARETFGLWVAGRRRAHLLPVAHFAERYFQRLGFRPEATYPFGYFRGGASDLELSRRSSRDGGRDLLYVGQLIPRKGIDVLLTAIAPLCTQNPRLRMTLVGDGESRGALEAQAAALGIAERVAFAGVIPSQGIKARIAEADVLVLPSRWDGWGMVVNEAFSVGVPVIVSDRCGAADIVDHGRSGLIFRSEDAANLRACIEAALVPGAVERMGAKALETGKLISAERAAVYMIDCIRHIGGELDEAPVPPWSTARRAGGSPARP